MSVQQVHADTRGEPAVGPADRAVGMGRHRGCRVDETGVFLGGGDDHHVVVPRRCEDPSSHLPVELGPSHHHVQPAQRRTLVVITGRERIRVEAGDGIVETCQQCVQLLPERLRSSGTGSRVDGRRWISSCGRRVDRTADRTVDRIGCVGVAVPGAGLGSQGSKCRGRSRTVSRAGGDRPQQNGRDAQELTTAKLTTGLHLRSSP